MRLSVTVSMAALTRGTFNVIFRPVSRVDRTSTRLGRICRMARDAGERHRRSALREAHLRFGPPCPVHRVIVWFRLPFRHGSNARERRRSGAMALLVLLAASAGTRVVAADLGGVSRRTVLTAASSPPVRAGRGRSVPGGPPHPAGGLPAMPPEVRCTTAGWIGGAGRAARTLSPSLATGRKRHKILDHLLVDPLLHPLKHREALALVFDRADHAARSLAG